MASNELKVRERDFLDRLLNPDSETYANQTKSYQEAYSNDNYDSSASNASSLLKRPKIQGYLQRIITEQGAGIQDRIKNLTDVYHGTHKRKVEKYGIHPETGDMRQTGYTESEPSFMERVRAIDVLSKLAGDYEQRRAESDIAVIEYRALCKDVFKELEPRKVNGTASQSRAIKPSAPEAGQRGDGSHARDEESLPCLSDDPIPDLKNSEAKLED